MADDDDKSDLTFSDGFLETLEEVARITKKAMDDRYPTDAAYAADYQKAKTMFAEELKTTDEIELHDLVGEAMERAATMGAPLEQIVTKEIQIIHRLNTERQGGSGARN